jgi:hypothetical protein
MKKGRAPEGARSQCIRRVLRPGISTRVPLVFLRLQANVKIVPKIQADTACFSCSPPDVSLSKLILAHEAATLHYPSICQIFKIPRELCTKLTVLTYFNNVLTDTQASEHCSERTHQTVGFVCPPPILISLCVIRDSNS